MNLLDGEFINTSINIKLTFDEEFFVDVFVDQRRKFLCIFRGLMKKVFRRELSMQHYSTTATSSA